MEAFDSSVVRQRKTLPALERKASINFSEAAIAVAVAVAGAGVAVPVPVAAKVVVEALVGVQQEEEEC